MNAPVFPRVCRQQPLVTLRDIGVTYGSGATALRAVADVSLSVHRQQVLMLTGPSGSGKTTLLQVIGLLLRPNDGAVTLDGHEVTDIDERRRVALRRDNCGFVFQGYNLFRNLTAVENVMVGFDLKGVRLADARARAAALLTRFDLASKLDSYPANLSGGQKQRVAIARAIAGDPPLILADEPTAALDTDAGQSVVRILRGLAVNEQRAVVVVTHDHRVLDQADRVIQLRDGRCVPVGMQHEGGL
jgi:putative ABC transport system ATP-binding protein